MTVLLKSISQVSIIFEFKVFRAIASDCQRICDLLSK